MCILWAVCFTFNGRHFTLNGRHVTFHGRLFHIEWAKSPLHACRGERFQKDGRPRSGYKAYACSKLALTMFARELQRRLRTAAPGAAGSCISHRSPQGQLCAALIFHVCVGWH